MTSVTLSALPKGNGYQAIVTIANVTFNSAETYPTIAEAIAAAANKLLGMPERLAQLDEPQTPVG